MALYRMLSLVLFFFYILQDQGVTVVAIYRVIPGSHVGDHSSEYFRESRLWPFIKLFYAVTIVA
jgi:hypothetical protein